MNFMQSVTIQIFPAAVFPVIVVLMFQSLAGEKFPKKKNPNRCLLFLYKHKCGSEETFETFHIFFPFCFSKWDFIAVHYISIHLE